MNNQFEINLSLDNVDQSKCLFDPSPRSVQIWIDNLPKANLIESAKLVHNSLNNLVDTQHDANSWFESLLLFSDVTEYLSDMLHQQYLEDSGIHPQKKRQFMSLVLSLYQIIAGSYQTLVANRKSTLTTENQLFAIYKAFTHLQKYLLRCFQMYGTPNKTVIESIKALYQYAEEKHITSTYFKDPSISATHVTNIHKTFKATLLLLTCSPYQLVPQDLQKIYDNLHSWADLCILNQTIKESDLYIVDLGNSTLPEYQSIFNRDKSGILLRGFNTNRLVESIEKEIEYIQSKKADEKAKRGISAWLLHHLSRTWSKFPTREFIRTRESGRLNAAVGLTGVHFYLNNQSDDVIPPKASRRPEEAGFSVEEELELLPLHHSSTRGRHYQGNSHEFTSNNDPWTLTYASRFQETPSVKKAGVEQMKMSFHQWELINSSASGYCLCTSSDYPQELKAGKIIGLQEDTDGNAQYWQIGVIRWIKYTDDDELQIGIELISPNAIAVGVQTQEHFQNQYKMIRALLLPSIPGIDEHATLIVPRLPFKTNDVIRVANQYIDADIKLEAQQSYSNFYSRFTFRLLEEYYDEMELVN